MKPPSLFEPDPWGSKNDAAPEATGAGVKVLKVQPKDTTKPLSPPAHHAAPFGTSSVAAKQAAPRCPSARSRLLKEFERAGSYGLTDEEGESALDLKSQSYTPRRRELVQLGLVIDSGQRRHTTSGRPAAVWILASAVQGSFEVLP